jgi:phosphatidylinositol glycan class K
MKKLYILILIIMMTLIKLINNEISKDEENKINKFLSNKHSNNWVVIVCTSVFWFNYRHVANALSIYHIVKNNGVQDSNIILMLAEDIACNPRNPIPGTVFNNDQKTTNIYGENVEVDYKKYEVTIENFLRLMTGNFF